MEHRITHACGHAQAHFIPGFADQQARKARWLGTTTCRDCFLAARRAVEAEGAAEDAAAVARLPLAALVGSERQIAWATTIRARRLAALVEEGQVGQGRDHPCLAIDDAKWWIDRRDAGDSALLRAAELFVAAAPGLPAARTARAA